MKWLLNLCQETEILWAVPVFGVWAVGLYEAFKARKLRLNGAAPKGGRRNGQ